MLSKRVITTIDSHTAGHPTRVVTGGIAPLRGATVAERRDDFRAHHDALRTFLLHEPRGHAAMVGVVMTESRVADFGAFFLGSYTYLEMCGHATIGLAVTLDYMGLVRREGEAAHFTLEVPAGIISVHLTYSGDRIAAVTFDNVPAFVAARDVEVIGPSGPVHLDVAYGGNWYALVEADRAEIDLTPSGVSRAMTVGAAIKQAVNTAIAKGELAGVPEPVDSVLFYRTEEGGGIVSNQLVVLAANKFDRSPCGTGTSARLAQLVDQGRITTGQEIRSRNILGVTFSASAAPCPEKGSGYIRPSVAGLAHITGQHTFLLEDGDPLPTGFLCS